MVIFKIPEGQLSALLNVVVTGAWTLCSGDGVTNIKLRQSAESIVQSLYEQAYQMGGSDEVWKNPRDGRYEHPTFPEQQGEAWEATQQHMQECIEICLVERAARLLALRDDGPSDELTARCDAYQDRLQDVVDAEGCEGLIDALVNGRFSG